MVIPRRFGSNNRHFGTLYRFHLRPPAHEDGTDRGFRTSAIRTKTPGNYPKENTLHIEHGESLKSRIKFNVCSINYLFQAHIYLPLRHPFCTYTLSSAGATSELLRGRRRSFNRDMYSFV